MILNSPYISGSLTVTGNEVVTGSLTVLGGITGAITGSATSASFASNTSFLNGSGSGEFVPTGSFNTFSSSILTYTGSANSRLGSLETASGSAITRLSALEVTSGSNITRLGALEVASGSAISRLSSLETTSGSNITRLSSLEAKTGSYATTGSNTFDGGQYLSSSFNPTGFSTTASLYTDGGLRVTRDAYISGTLYLNNVTVFGTQSVAYISSSQLNIGTNIISVNTDIPSVRFGGLAVYDSGSTGLTGSMLWDSQDNQWIYSNPSGSTYDSAMFLVGPRNTGTLGNEVGINCNFLSKGNGMHHMTSSAIFEDGSVTCIGTGASITSAGIACFANQICAQGATFTTTGNTAVTIASGATSLSRLVFQGTVGNARGFIDYDNSTCGFIIRTNENTALTIGNTGVSTFSSCVNIGGASTTNDLNIYNTNNAGITLQTSYTGTTGNDGFYIGQSFQSTNFLFRQRENADVIFETNNGSERLRITSAGIACFACRVCVSTLVINAGCIINPNSSGTEIWNGEVKFGGTMCIYQGQPNGAFSDRTDLVFVTNTGFGLGVSEKMRLTAGGNLGIGIPLPCTELHVTLETCYGTNGTIANSYPVATFSQCDCAAGARGLQIGVPTGGIDSPVFLKVNNTSARFSIINQSNCENFTLSNSGIACFRGEICVRGTSIPNDLFSFQFLTMGA